MKWLLAFLGLLLIGVAAAGFYASVDLLTVEIGVLYATCSAVALAAALVILSLAALTFRIDALRAAILRQGVNVPALPPVPAPTPADPPAEETDPAPPTAENSADPLPPTPASEPVPNAPAEPTLLKRYSAGRASYKIFSDGSIEAETEQGAFRFASMDEFKAYVAAKQA